MRPSDTWICVADTVRAQFYRCDGRGRCIEPLLDFALVARQHSPHPLLAAMPAFDDRGRFAGRVAGQLDLAADGHLFEHLLLVAPQSMLEPLKRTLKPHTRRLVIGEVDKDLTRATPREVATHICDKLPH